MWARICFTGWPSRSGRPGPAGVFLEEAADRVDGGRLVAGGALGKDLLGSVGMERVGHQVSATFGGDQRSSAQFGGDIVVCAGDGGRGVRVAAERDAVARCSGCS